MFTIWANFSPPFSAKKKEKKTTRLCPMSTLFQNLQGRHCDLITMNLLYINDCESTEKYIIKFYTFS